MVICARETNWPLTMDDRHDINKQRADGKGYDGSGETTSAAPATMNENCSAIWKIADRFARSIYEGKKLTMKKSIVGLSISALLLLHLVGSTGMAAVASSPAGA
jgi:hypothetical protein